MTNSKISVLTPVFNTAPEYLRECIDSVLAQTFTDFEFIILDNGSEPYVADIVKSYDDARIRFFRLERNIGPAAGRNFCIEHAHGAYLAILDSDDVALPARLATQAAFLDTNPDVGVVGTHSRTTDGNEFFSDSLPTNDEEIRRYLVFCGNMFCHSSIMMRADVLRKNNVGYDAECFPAEDYSLWLQLADKTRFARLPDVLVLYRPVADGASRKNMNRQFYQAARAQLGAIGRIYGVDVPNIDCLARVYAGDGLESRDAAAALDTLVKSLNEQNLPGDKLYEMYRGQFKHICYHTHSLGGQWRLMTSPMAGYFGMGIGWRGFCLVTRGIFGHKHNTKKDKK